MTNPPLEALSASRHGVGRGRDDIADRDPGAAQWAAEDQRNLGLGPRWQELAYPDRRVSGMVHVGQQVPEVWFIYAELPAHWL